MIPVCETVSAKLGLVGLHIHSVLFRNYFNIRLGTANNLIECPLLINILAKWFPSRDQIAIFPPARMSTDTDESI
jgi:hypothetical protein